ncbi:MAG: peptidylprolyl isomerase [Brachymonas sp.]|nr:peptidylprolyl isomerase [Brachymonas sp.]
MELYPAAAPKTVENFLHYVDSGHYAGTIFHRVIDNFMVQGGGFDGQYAQKPTKAPIAHEGESSSKAGLKNTVGTVAMARTNDPNSATAQFFINVKDNAFLDYKSSTPQGWGYVVFGKVISGMDVVEKIRTTPTGAAGPFASDVPTKTVVIESARQIK